MRDHTIRTRPPRAERTGADIARDADLVARVAEDAAHFPGGHAAGVVSPITEADVADAIRRSRTVLPIGAQSSLTGGATPMGEVVVSLARANRILAIGGDTVRAQAGVTLVDLDAALRRCGKYYPPAPTFAGAFVGGIAATNAAGAATFKYGTTRAWVAGLTVVLANGEVLDLERGAVHAHADGYFDVLCSTGSIRVPVPTYRMPRTAKLSAGYFAAPGMDLVDLFVGSEGTLGVITDVTLRVVRERPAMCLAFVPFRSRVDAMAFVGLLRRTARETWHSHDPRGLDVSAIEHMDGRCLALLREDGVDRQTGVPMPEAASIALLVTLELPFDTSPADAFDQIGRYDDVDTPLARFCRALAAAGVLDDVEIAVPGDESRAAQLLAVREAVPAGVNARVGRAKSRDGRIAKTAADMIVPFERLQELMELYDAEFRRRGLDAAVWGHISDGNLHPNVIPRSMDDVESGKEAIRLFGRAAIRMGGSPLAEHGVGRNPIKQALLRDLYGDAGIAQMRAVKRALDPDHKLAPGVLFADNE
jgi:D-lactate dehydrogenase (cytochrome)